MLEWLLAHTGVLVTVIGVGIVSLLLAEEDEVAGAVAVEEDEDEEEVIEVVAGDRGRATNSVNTKWHSDD